MDFLKDYYDTEGPLGIPMKDAQAQALDALLRELPQDDLHAPGKLIVKGVADLLPGERADISWISTESTDRERDVLLARGMDDSHYALNPIVTLQHAYWMPPAGRSLWRRKVSEDGIKGVKAKTLYPTRPESLPEDSPWLPDEMFPLLQAGLCNGKSVGFIPRKARWFGRIWSWGLPVLDHEASNPAELGRIVGNQGAAPCQRNGGDQQVIAADEQAPPGQVRTNPTVLFGSAIIERQGGELLP
jgi:hypothetical protein